jgi:hypothetical protein
MTTSGTPTPKPIFAPFDNPLGLGTTLGELVGSADVGLVVLSEGSVVVGVNELELGVGPVAAEKAFESELCHQTGIPSPWIV